MNCFGKNRRSAYAILLAGAALFIVFATMASAAPTPQDATLSLYLDARDLALSGRYSEAAAAFENLLKNFPNSAKAPDASYMLAFCFDKMGNQQTAFLRYRDTTDKYPGTIGAHRAAQRAVDLAKTLRQRDGDTYDQFLRSILERQGVGSASAARLTALGMAQMGNWSGLDRLLDGLENGSNIERIQISEVLRYKADDPQVREAFIRVLTSAQHPIVRLNAISGLSRFVSDDRVRASLIQVMLRDTDPGLRGAAAHSLYRALDRDDVLNGYREFLEKERDPRVLMPVVSLLESSGKSGGFEKVVVARLGSEPDPMIKVLLTSMLRGEELTSGQGMVVLRSLADNQEPMIRLNALRMLLPLSSEPAVRAIFMQKLEKDPNDKVRTVALNALSGQMSDESVRKAVLETLHTSSDIGLLVTSVRALSPQLNLPEVRQGLLEMLRTVSEPIVAGQLTAVLTPAFSDAEVGKAVIERLRSFGDPEIRMAIAAAMENVRIAVLPPGLDQLYLSEPNELLAGRYLRVIQQVNPDLAQELARKRPLHGFSFEIRIQSKKK